MGLKVAAFTGGRHVPAARFRIRQYIERLREEEIELAEFAAPLNAYPPPSRVIRPIWGLASLASRLPGIVRSFRYDLTLLQREMLSTFTTLEGLTKRPRLLDVDDAIWVYRGGIFASRLAEICDGVICGNSFLAGQFGYWNRRVTIIPTGVDTNRFVPREPVDELVIGWSGTRGGFKYLYAIEPALSVVLDKVPDVRLRIVSDAMPVFGTIPTERIEFIRWSPETEVAAIQGMAIGIMPLDDSVWARGKCAFKMLTYMSCGIPVVVSPVGMNGELLSQAVVGFGPRNNDEWVDVLCSLLDDSRTRLVQGGNGRRLVVERYSVNAIVPRLAHTLRNFGSGKQ